MLELENKLALYGLGMEDALEAEEQYHEYRIAFTENELYLKVVRELTQEIFERFASGSEDEAKCAHYEIQALKSIIEKLKSFEHEFMKVKAIEDQDVVAETY